MSEQQSKKPTHLFATIGARTERGGWIAKASSELHIRGLTVACVGDEVVYEDGSRATIIDGAGRGATWRNTPFALVGSHLSNGDTIATTLQDREGVHVREGQSIPGLFDSAYISLSLTATSGDLSHA